jgi:ATP-dependent DNA helicase RecG
MPQLRLDTPVEQIFMIGPVYAKRLKKLQLYTAENLLHHYPSRYLDFSQITSIKKIKPETVVTIQGTVVSCQNIYTKLGKKIQQALVKDSSGQIPVTWFNQPFIPKVLKPGLLVNLAGKTQFYKGRLTLVSPEFELIKPGKMPIHTGRLVPIYPETAGVSSKWLRSRINLLLNQLLKQTSDWLPSPIKTRYQLADLNPSLRIIHFPDNSQQLEAAKKRLSFDELFLLQLEALIRKKNWQTKKLSHRLRLDQEKILNLIASLPFRLTAAQNRCLKEILTDLTSNQPMNRLLQGDVGSGKTVVAALAIYLAQLNGFQSALMAPTEILANQHLQTLKTVFAPTSICLELVTGSTKKKKSKSKKSRPDVFIGTHALLFRQLKLSRLGLVVIDEQHRFGVQQRAQIIEKSQLPHVLTMTATPIPRTIALALYADLDLSIIDKLPAGRKLVKTWVVPPEKRLSAYHWIETQIKTNRSQAFIVCPLIEESDKETMKNIKAVTAEFNQLKQVFSDLKLALLHGRMKSKEKEKVLDAFRRGKTDILVSTPLIEVGIDIPNATIMLIEDADRFGLAQIHQLRGRVGRGPKSSHCLIFSQSNNPVVLERLKYLEKLHSGLKLAEVDLKLRGPGELYGLKQHGFFQLKLASFTDKDLIKQTRQAATSLIKANRLQQYPGLLAQLKKRTITQVEPN